MSYSMTAWVAGLWGARNLCKAQRLFNQICQVTAWFVVAQNEVPFRVLSFSKFIGQILSSASFCGTSTSISTPGFRVELLQFSLNRKGCKWKKESTCLFMSYIRSTFKGLDQSVNVTSALQTGVNASIIISASTWSIWKLDAMVNNANAHMTPKNYSITLILCHRWSSQQVLEASLL